MDGWGQVLAPVVREPRFKEKQVLVPNMDGWGPGTSGKRTKIQEKQVLVPNMDGWGQVLAPVVREPRKCRYSYLPTATGKGRARYYYRRSQNKPGRQTKTLVVLMPPWHKREHLLW